MTEYTGALQAIGNTPLIKLKYASELTGCTILGKAEYANPGGSLKDRPALNIIEEAEKKGLLEPGGLIVEGTAGNTGIGISVVANAKGYRCLIVMPDNQSREKIDTLTLMGAELKLVPPVPYSNPNNFQKVAKRLAEELSATEKHGVIWANQFDNLANREAHIKTTAQEIWQQTDGKVDAFITAIGSGGSLAGTGIGLKEHNKDIRIVLADPMGAAMYSYFKTGELRSEGTSITEGIGQGRITANIEGAPIDDAYQVTDHEALPMAFDLLRREGLCVGSSTGLNVAGAIKLAKDMGPGHTIVTLLCDSGLRYQSKMFNPEFLREKSLPVPEWLDI
ncbi:MAG: cysteine synthase A [Kordiimonadales bacterium]|nr:MAG: cysteine synthase A [Kordiimonadales bacterium]